MRQIGRIGRLFKGNGGTKDDEVPQGIPCIRYGDLYTKYRYFIKQSLAFVTEERSSSYTPIQYGDVLFAGSGETIEEIGKSAVNLIESRACCGGDLVVFRPAIAVDAGFMGYANDCPQAAYQKSRMGRGITVKHIYDDQLKYLWIALPPLDEQGAIFRLLRHSERRIDRAIRAKQKMIALLNERKQAIIHQTVTRGLDPNVRLKPSGVEWLGDVPEHWRVRPAKYFYREVDYRSSSGEEELLSVSHITGVTPRSQKNITMFKAASYVGHKVCGPGDLVINTMWAWMGALGVARQSGIVSPSYGVYRPLATSPLIGEYADLLLRTKPYVNEYTCRSTGIRSSRLRLYPEQFLKIRLICPPADEQRAIVDYVEDRTVEINRAIEFAQHEISLLREYRTRLVADLVTGKFDAREAAAQLPDEIEGTELLDEIEPDEASEAVADDLEGNLSDEEEEAAA